jgi:hypothetical protein
MDTVWHLDGLRPGCNRSDFSLDWGFLLDDESRFTDPRWACWCDAAKTFLWSLKADPPSGSVAAHDATLIRRFKQMRLLIRWMATEGYRRFADLDRDAAERFLALVAARPGMKAGQTVSHATRQSYCRFLITLHAQGGRYEAVAIADPFPGGIVGDHRGERGWLPYTPDEVAVPLVAAALRLIGASADDVVALQALARGIDQSRAVSVVVDAIAGFSFVTLPNEAVPWHGVQVTSTKQLRVLIDRLYDACFIVVAYLVGARVSEILGLQTGCIEWHPSGGGSEEFAYLAGRIYKTARDSAGTAHRWVAPAPVERAIFVMERLSEPLRRRTGRTDLWLVMTSTGLIGPAARIETPVSSTIITRLNKSFAPFIDLPLHKGKPWHLNTHQGRKTFARFVGKRDRTGLDALRDHLAM